MNRHGAGNGRLARPVESLAVNEPAEPSPADEFVALVTGSRGPLRTTLDFLRRFGLGERVLKSAVASALAWQLAGLIPGNPNPILAAITGLFSINLTIAASVKDAVQRMLGVLWGVGVALIINALFGLHAWTLALVVIAAFLGGRRLRLESAGLSQMAVSALFIILGAAGSPANNVAWLHLLNSLVGTVVGIALNAAIAPPSYLPAARNALDELSDQIAAIHRDLAQSLANGISLTVARSSLDRSRQLADAVEAIDHVIERADEGLKYHIQGRSQRVTLAVYHRSSRALEHAAIQTRVISRTLLDIIETAEVRESRPGWIEPNILGSHLGDLITTVADAVAHHRRLVDHPYAPAESETPATRFADHRRRLTDAASDQLPMLMPDGWILLGEVIALSGQLVSDLSAAEDDFAALTSSRSPSQPRLRLRQRAFAHRQ